MTKAPYALAFMALCGVILVVHEMHAPESLKESEDPFLAAVEKHVVATAQRRLSKVFAEEASQKHISEARKQIKASLREADNDSFFRVQKAEAEMQIREMQATAQPVNAVAATAAPMKLKTAPVKQLTIEQLEAGAPVKQFTIEQLEAGEDAIEHTTKKKSAATKNLMANLLTAPKMAGLSEEDNKYMKKEEQMEEKTKDEKKKADTVAPSLDSDEQERMTAELNDDDDLISQATSKADEMNDTEKEAPTKVAEKAAVVKKTVKKSVKAVKKVAPKKDAVVVEETEVKATIEPPTPEPKKDKDSEFEYKDDDDDFGDYE